MKRHMTGGPPAKLPRCEGNPLLAGLEVSEAQELQRAPSSKYALAIGYLGTGFSGMQKQPTQEFANSVKTVEGTLEQCLHSCRVLPEGAFGDFRRLQWTRVARTDKGVHAACNVVSLKLKLGQKKAEAEDESGQENSRIPAESISHRLQWFAAAEARMLSDLREALPPQIRVFGCYRVCPKFDARVNCARREYEYMIPSYLLAPMEFSSPGLRGLSCWDSPAKFEPSKHEIEFIEAVREGHGPTALPFGGQTWGEDGKEGFRLTEDDLKRFQSIICEYVGTKNFYNFTTGLLHSNPAARRYLEKAEARLTALGDSGQQFVVVKLVGQSFLLNQVRKMIGLAIEIYRESAPRNSIQLAFGASERLPVRMAPAEGLFLNGVSYDSYNDYRATPPSTPKLTFEDFAHDIVEFKETFIYNEIRRTAEAKENNVWDSWSAIANAHPFVWEGVVVPAVAGSPNSKKTE